MPWLPDQSGNLKGPGPGPRIHHRNREVFEEIKNRGYQNPLITLAELSAGSQDEGIRASAAASLSPYMHPKLQSLPTPRYIEEPIEVPEFATVEEATQFIAKLESLTAGGKLDFQSATELVGIAKVFIDAKVSSDLETRVLNNDLLNQQSRATITSPSGHMTIYERSPFESLTSFLTRLTSHPGTLTLGGLPPLPGTSFVSTQDS